MSTTPRAQAGNCPRARRRSHGNNRANNASIADRSPPRARLSRSDDSGASGACLRAASRLRPSPSSPVGREPPPSISCAPRREAADRTHRRPDAAAGRACTSPRPAAPAHRAPSPAAGRPAGTSDAAETSTAGTSHSTNRYIDSSAGPNRRAPCSVPVGNTASPIAGGSAPPAPKKQRTEDSRVNRASSLHENRPCGRRTRRSRRCAETLNGGPPDR